MTTNVYLHLPQLLVSLFILWMAVFVLKNNYRASTHIGFAIAAFTTSMWLLLYFIAYCVSSDRLSYYFFKVGYSFVIFMGLGVYHFVSAYIQFKKEMKVVYFCYAIGLIFNVLLWNTDYFILRDLYHYSWGLYPKAYIFQILFVAFIMAIIARFLVLLYKRYKENRLNNDAAESVKSKYVFLSFMFLSLASYDFLPNYGLPLFPIGFLFAGAYMSVMAYAILKHQVLDIEVIIRRTTVFAGLFVFVYAIFTVVTLVGQEFVRNNLNWNQWLAMIPTVLIITLALRRVDTLLTNATEKLLFQKKYDYRELLRLFNNEILQVLDLDKLTEQTVAGLNNIIKLESAAMLLYNKDTKEFRIAASYGVKNKNMIFTDKDTLVTYLKAFHGPILKDKTADKIEGDGELKQSFRALNAQLCLPIQLHVQLIGILALGMKKSGEDYTQDDQDTLMSLCGSIAIAISNAQQYDENAKTQAVAMQNDKMAVIGTLAAGINHEICNPLGIVRGQCEMFLLNSRDGFYKDKSAEEIIKISEEVMDKVIHETDRATGITKKLSSFAKPSRNIDEKVYVEKEVDEVLSLVGHDMKLSNIDIQKEFSPDFPAIIADKKQMQEVFFNIIRNAMQAIGKEKKEGRITLSGSADNGSAVISIADNGGGIPKNNIGQIFNPFYTTKGPKEGTGLGLFIVKQVVERNKGAISVESEEGVGTTFTLRFPRPSPA